MSRALGLLALTFTFLLAATGVAQATDRYASPSGSGSTCSSGTPCTLATAVSNSASSGDRVLLKSGSYGTWTGTSKTSLTITPDSGVSPSIDLDLGSGDGGFTIDGGHNATWSGLGLTINGGSITGTASNITIKNSKFPSELDIDGPMNSNIVLDHNKHYDLSTGYAIHFPYGNGGTDESGVTVKNSLFSNLTSDGITIGAVGVDVLNNEFVDVYPHGTGAHTDAIQLDSGANSTIDGNWVHGTCEQGIGGFDGIYNVVITNNVVEGCSTHYLVVGGSFTPSSDPTSLVAHNTVHGANGLADIDCSAKVTNSWGQTMYPTKVTIRDNIATNGIQMTGDVNCSPTNGTNMFHAGASGTNFNGDPTFTGGSTPTTYAGYALTCASAGHNAASDGTNVGAITGSEPSCTPSPFVTDTFTGTSVVITSHTPDSGGSWGAVTGQNGSTWLSSVSGGVRETTSTGTGRYWANVTVPDADYKVEATLKSQSGLGAGDVANTGVGCRMVTSADTGYFGRYSYSNARWEIIEENSGTATTTVGTSYTMPASTSVPIELDCVGSAITLKRTDTGATVASLTDSTITAAGRPGIRILNNPQAGTEGIHLDDFSATDL